MDKFPEIWNLLILTYEEIENVNKPIASAKVKSAIKCLPTQKSLVEGSFTGQFF
jgi:hypothetical protein